MNTWSRNRTQAADVEDPDLAQDGAERSLVPDSSSVIGETTEISGTVTCKGEVRIDGRFDGDLTCQDLMVGEEAEIRGTVIAERVRVHGTLDGLVRAGTLSISKTAHVTGELFHRNLKVETGASVEGTTRRLGIGTELSLPEHAGPDGSSELTTEAESGPVVRS